MKKSIKILITLLISLVFLLALLGSGETETPEKVGEAEKTSAPDSTSNVSTPSTAPSESTIPNNSENENTNSTKPFKIGDIIEMSDMQFCVNGIRTSTGGEYFKPDEGNQYIMLDISIKNISAETQNSSSLLMYKIVDIDGRSYGMDFFAETNGSLDRQLGSGRKARGEIAYQVPNDIQYLELEIDPNIFGSGLIIVELPLETANSEFVGAFANDFSDNLTHYKIGDKIKLGNLNYTVNSISTNTGSQYFGPDEGNVYLLLDITIENTGSDSAHISSLLTFNLMNNEGMSYKISLFADTQGSLDGEIGTGRKMTGELAYEVPLDTSMFELEVYDSILNTGLIVVDITLE